MLIVSSLKMFYFIIKVNVQLKIDLVTSLLSLFKTFVNLSSFFNVFTITEFFSIRDDRLYTKISEKTLKFIYKLKRKYFEFTTWSSNVTNEVYPRCVCYRFKLKRVIYLSYLNVAMRFKNIHSLFHNIVRYILTYKFIEIFFRLNMFFWVCYFKNIAGYGQ